MTQTTFLAPAKLNRFLHITGRRQDGYHNLQTLFQFIDFCDQITFSETEQNGDIRLTTPFVNVAPEENLIIKAAQLLKQTTQTPKGALITINKQLPMGGGLGGGSSNAATTLVALNHLWGTQLNNRQLQELGRQLGADVPIFIHGRTALAEGIGDQFTDIEIDEPWYLLMIPNCQVETAALFADKQLTRNSMPITIRAVLDGDGHNDFEPVARRLFPLLDRCMNLLSSVKAAKLTGTGACIFAEFDCHKDADAAAETILAKTSKFELTSSDFEAKVVKGLNYSPLYAQKPELALKK